MCAKQINNKKFSKAITFLFYLSMNSDKRDMFKESDEILNTNIKKMK